MRVRIFNCTGPRKVGDALSDFVRRTVWLERHPETNLIRVGNLETRRTIVDVRDLNRGLILLLERGKSGEVLQSGRHDRLSDESGAVTGSAARDAQRYRP